MGYHIASQAMQLTPLIVAIIIFLIALVLSMYWGRARRMEANASPRWIDDAELVLLSGLLLIAIGVIFGFVLLLLISANNFAVP
jgi:cbb3-type cytochrome oxidase subunit 3